MTIAQETKKLSIRDPMSGFLCPKYKNLDQSSQYFANNAAICEKLQYLP